jgi:methyl-accepting chemotaxis protein
VTLGAVRAELNSFIGSTEEVFLPAGERLSEVREGAREIVGRCRELASLLDGDDGSLEILDQVLRRAREDQQRDDVVRTVEGVESSSRGIHKAIEAVNPLVRTFDVLGVMTRIESSRFAGAGEAFAGLADSVSSLSQQIREQIGSTAESAGILVATTCQAAEQVRRVARARQENLGPLIRQTSAGLAKMRDHHGRVSRASARLSEDFRGVSEAIGELVMALQSHDIVRQQIEHVCEALEKVGGADARADVHETARLQAAQLEHSHATFEKSVRQIQEALGQIGRNIDQVAAQASELLDDQEGSGASYFAAVEADLANIAAMLRNHAAADRSLSEAAGGVRGRVGEISSTIAGVREVGIEMQRIALNATMQAARLGPAGGALEVVAQAIQELARRAETTSDTIEELLGALRSDAETLTGATRAREGAGGQMDEIDRSAVALRSAQDRAVGGYAGAMEAVAGLRRRLGDTLAAFDTQDACLELLAGAIGRLRALAAESETAGQPARAPEKAAAATYTMQSERAVHEALYEASRPQPEGVLNGAPAAESAKSEATDDNVEFF